MFKLIKLVLILLIGFSLPIRYLFSDYRGKWRLNALSSKGEPEIIRKFNTTLHDGGIQITRGYLQMQSYIPDQSDSLTFFSWCYFEPNLEQERLIFDLSNNRIASLYYNNYITFDVYITHKGETTFKQIQTPILSKHSSWIFLYFRYKPDMLNRTIINVGYFEPAQHIFIENTTTIKGIICPKIIQTDPILFRSGNTYVRSIELHSAYLNMLINEIELFHPTCQYAAGPEEYDCISCKSALYDVTKVYPYKKMCKYNGECSSLCSKCYGSNYTECLECSDNAVMARAYTCMCKERYYYNNEIKSCDRCSKGCMECSSQECLQCDKGYFLDKGVCGKCHYLCEECNKAGIDGCTVCISESGVIKARIGCQCDEANYYYLTEYRCIKKCNELNDGYVDIILCKGICEEGCDICRLPLAHNCTKCHEGYEMKKGECQKTTEHNYLTWVTSITAILISGRKLFIFFGKKIVVKVVMFLLMFYYSKIKKKVANDDELSKQQPQTQAQRKRKNSLYRSMSTKRANKKQQLMSNI